MNCPEVKNPEIAEQFLLDLLDEAAKIAYEHHLAACQRCRASLQEQRTLLRGLENSGRQLMKEEILTQARRYRSAPTGWDVKVYLKLAAALLLILMGPALIHLFNQSGENVAVPIDGRGRTALSDRALDKEKSSAPPSTLRQAGLRERSEQPETDPQATRSEKEAAPAPELLAREDRFNPAQTADEVARVAKQAVTPRAGDSLELAGTANSEPSVQSRTAGVRISTKQAEALLLSFGEKSAGREPQRFAEPLRPMDSSVLASDTTLVSMLQGARPGVRQPVQSKAQLGSMGLTIESDTTGHGARFWQFSLDTLSVLIELRLLRPEYSDLNEGEGAAIAESFRLATLKSGGNLLWMQWDVPPALYHAKPEATFLKLTSSQAVLFVPGGQHYAIPLQAGAIARPLHPFAPDE